MSVGRRVVRAASALESANFYLFEGILHCPSKVVYTFLRRAIEIEIEIGIAILIEMK